METVCSRLIFVYMPKSYWLNIGPYPIGLPSFGITFTKMSERRYEAFEKTTGSSVDAPVPEAPPVPSTTPKLDANYHLVVVALLLSIAMIAMNKKDLFEIEKWKR